MSQGGGEAHGDLSLTMYLCFFFSRGDQTTAETVLPWVPFSNTALIQKKMHKEASENTGSSIDQKESEQSFMYFTHFLKILLYFQVFWS